MRSRVSICARPTNDVQGDNMSSDHWLFPQVEVFVTLIQNAAM